MPLKQPVLSGPGAGRAVAYGSGSSAELRFESTSITPLDEQTFRITGRPALAHGLRDAFNQTLVSGNMLVGDNVSLALDISRD